MLQSLVTATGWESSGGNDPTLHQNHKCGQEAPVPAPVPCTSAVGAGDTEEPLAELPPLSSWCVLAPVCLLSYIKPLQMLQGKTAASFIVNLYSPP